MYIQYPTVHATAYVCSLHCYVYVRRLIFRVLGPAFYWSGSFPIIVASAGQAHILGIYGTALS